MKTTVGLYAAACAGLLAIVPNIPLVSSDNFHLGSHLIVWGTSLLAWSIYFFVPFGFQTRMETPKPATKPASPNEVAIHRNKGRNL